MAGSMNRLLVSVLGLVTLAGGLHQLQAQPIVWVSATRSASPDGSDTSLASWRYSAPVVVGLPALPWQDPPKEILAVHESVFHSSGVDIDLSAHTALRGGRLTGGQGKAAFQAVFTVAETTTVAFTITACRAVAVGMGETDVTESDLKLSLTKQGDSANLLSCSASDIPQNLSLYPGRYELGASVSPQERFGSQTWSVLKLTMKAEDGRQPPPLLPQELVAPRLEISGPFVRVLVPESVPGRRYQLQVSATALSGSWSDIESPRTGDGGPVAVETRHDLSAPQKFFRLALDPL